MKRLLLLCLMMVLAMAMFASHKRVSASVVNMRAEGSKNAQIVAKLSKGDVVEILQAGNWDYVDFQGQTGYIKSNLLTPLSDEEEAMMAPPPSEEVVPDDDSSSFFSSLVESPFTRHDWKWPIWVVIIVGILLVGVGFSNKEGDTSKESMFAQAGLFLFLSIMELVQFFLVEDPIWFCTPDTVGWVWTIINALLLVFIFYNQVRLFKHTLELANEYADRDCSWLWGLIGIPVGCGLGIWLISENYVFWGIAVMILPQIVQVAVLIVATINGGNDWVSLAVSLLVYVVGGLAVAVVIGILVWIAIVVFVAYLALSLAGKTLSDSSSSSSTYEPPVNNYDGEIDGKGVKFTNFSETEAKDDYGNTYEKHGFNWYKTND